MEAGGSGVCFRSWRQGPKVNCKAMWLTHFVSRTGLFASQQKQPSPCYSTFTALFFFRVSLVILWIRNFRFPFAGSWSSHMRSLEFSDLYAVFRQILTEPHGMPFPLWFRWYLQKLLGKRHSGSLPDSRPQSNILSADSLCVHPGCKCSNLWCSMQSGVRINEKNAQDTLIRKRKL